MMVSRVRVSAGRDPVRRAAVAARASDAVLAAPAPFLGALGHAPGWAVGEDRIRVTAGTGRRRLRSRSPDAHGTPLLDLALKDLG